MDIKEYLESGVLEEYVIRHQPNPEIEKLAAQYDEIRQEIEKIEIALEKYAQLNSISPPAGLLEKILERAKELSENDDH